MEGHQVHGGAQRRVPLASPLRVTLPDWSTSTSGPSHCTSKYDLMVMLYAEGVKKRLLTGARREEGLERKAERAEARRWGMAMMAGWAGCAKGCQTMTKYPRRSVNRKEQLCICFW
jgi:hypothetical protein